MKMAVPLHADPLQVVVDGCGAGDGSISVQIIRDNGSLNVKFGGCIGSENVI